MRKLIAVSIFAILGVVGIPSSSAQITLDGANHCTNVATGVTAISCTLPSVSAGDLITVEASDRNGYATSVSDATNGAYTAIYYVSDSADPNYSGMAYFMNSASGSLTVQMTLSGSDPWAIISVQAWKGAATSFVLDSSAITQNQTSTSGAVANATCGSSQLPAEAGDLIIGYLVPDWDNTVTAGTNYTLIDTSTSTGNPAFPEYWIQSTASATNAPFGSAADDWTEGCAAFKPAAPHSIAGIITTITGNGHYANSGDGGLAIDAAIAFPESMAVDSAGNIYIPDSVSNVVRKVSGSTGIITTIAGTGTQGYLGDGGLATNAQLNAPMTVAIDVSGNIYIADFNNNCIRKITVSTGIITTIAGTGTAGYSGDNGPAASAELSSPEGIAIDGSGNLYIADTGNNVVREVAASNSTITTIAGDGFPGYSGDNGPAICAELFNPASVTLDSSGNLYIGDYENHAVRKVAASSGTIATVAGNGTAGYAGDNGPATSAELSYPAAVSVDAAGNVYIADYGNHAIREVSATTGTISTVAGNGIEGYSGDGGPATSAELSYPHGVVVDTAGDLYIADCGNHVVRLVGGASQFPVSLSISPLTATLYEGQAQQFSARVTNTSNTAVTWSIGAGGAGSIDASGLYTAPPAVPAQQTVTLTATSQANAAVSASATVTLLPPVSVSVSPSAVTLSAGQAQQFTATVANTSNTAVAWSISPAGTGTLSSAGLYSAPASVTSQQTVTITATSQADTTRSTSATVTLSPTSCGSNGYSYQRSIVINHTKVTNTDQAKFPFLFNTTDPLLATTANNGHVTNPNGDDIIFTSDPAGQNVLSYEMEEYNPVTGQVIAWVQIPTLSHTQNTTIYMWYGNTNITTGQAQPSSVWDSNFEGVWHFPNGTTLSTNDSTANGNNGTNYGAVAALGKIDGGASFNGNSSYVDVGNLGIFPTQGTIEFWMQPSSLSSYPNAFTTNYSGGNNGIRFEEDSSGDFAVVIGDGSFNVYSLMTGTLQANTWYHIALTWDTASSNAVGYVNGSPSNGQVTRTGDCTAQFECKNGGTPPGATYFHYGYSSQAAGFGGGLWPGSFATTIPGLTGAQAKSGLALYNKPAPPDAMYIVTPEPCTPIIGPTPAEPQVDQFTGQTLPGGLPEVQFPVGTGPGTVGPPIPLPE
jgi:Concanavalin A-like lectin/glucanases superfamily/Domain of unknown function (DUF2341)/NHL repeat